MNITVKAFENADPDSAIKAHVNMTIDNAFVVKNLSVVQGKNGLFVNMPHHKSNEVGEDGKAVLVDVGGDAAIQSYENGGQEVSFEYESVQKEQNKTNPEKSGKEEARQGRSSVLKELKEQSKEPKGMDKPIKLSMAPKQKAVGEDR